MLYLGSMEKLKAKGKSRIRHVICNCHQIDWRDKQPNKDGEGLKQVYSI